MVEKMERGALSASLLALFALFTAQFFVGMALNLLVVPPMTTFPQNNSSFADAISYALTGGNYVLTSHFLIDMTIIAFAVVNLALIIHKSNVYRALSIGGFISVLFTFESGVRLAASNFTVDAISYQMAGGFLLAFILYFAMAMLTYRDLAVQAVT